jgi:hypothetical protein
MPYMLHFCFTKFVNIRKKINFFNLLTIAQFWSGQSSVDDMDDFMFNAFLLHGNFVVPV